jgi:cyclopropane fatty-acyl-phospholipid synthase-like methyltransferase
MAHQVCPWWLGYLLASPVRRLMQDPRTLVAPYVREGMTVLEPGPGMGFFTLELARLVGTTGRVLAVDIQPRMLSSLKRRAARAGIADLAGSENFTLAFALVQELPDVEAFFTDAAKPSKPGAALLFAAPAGHAKTERFEAELPAAIPAGFELTVRPAIRRRQAAAPRRRS